MLTVFDVDHSVGADMFDFKELCPAFIQQVKNGACKSSETDKEVHKDMGKSKVNLLMQKGGKVLQYVDVGCVLFNQKFQTFLSECKWELKTVLSSPSRNFLK